jgi:molybdate transport system regulatory protein
MAKALAVRFRVDFGRHCSVGVGKIELLEGIARTGSISQAARDMHMSYRRAWLLLEDMKLGFDQPVAMSSVGGPGGGGVVITEFGGRLITRYRELESELKLLAITLLDDFGNHVKGVRSKRVVQPPSIGRKPSAK